MTGRTLHDALLRTLTDGELRQRLLGGDPEGGGLLGPDEARTLARSDPDRLRRMARFMARHFYRERIVRLFRYGRALALKAGHDPLGLLESPEFRALLDSVVLGSAASADAVARLVEGRLLAAVAHLPFGLDLVRYEGTLFRVEAGPRRWQAGDGRREGIPARSVQTRVLELEWDLTSLMSAIRRGKPELPSPPRQPTRFLLALSPRGHVTTVRCPEPLSRFLDALDGRRTVTEAAAAAGLSEADVAPLLGQLTDMGAIEWRPTPPNSQR